jgi:hypothetical protein
MNQNISELERAFEMARAGRGVTEIKRDLKREGYSSDQIEGRGLMRQLKALIKAARP